MKRAGYASPREAADMSGLSERQIWRKLRDGSLPHDKVGGRVWIPLADVPARKVDPLEELRAEVEELRRRVAELEKRPKWAPSALSFDSDRLTAPDVQPHRRDTPASPVAPLSASRPDVSVADGHDGEIPAGSERCKTFANRHDFSETNARRWADKQWRAGRRELVIIRPDPHRGDHNEVWVTPEGQDALLDEARRLQWIH